MVVEIEFGMGNNLKRKRVVGVMLFFFEMMVSRRE